MYRNRAPSVADTMSVFSGPSLRGSIHGDEPIQPRNQFQPTALPPKPTRPPVGQIIQQKVQNANAQENPYQLFKKPDLPKLNLPKTRTRPLSQYAGSAKKKQVNFVKQPGQYQVIPGIGPYLPQGAAKQLARPMMRGAKPQPTGIFDTKAVIPPTQFSEMYTTGRIPARVELKKKEGEPGPPGGRDIFWKVEFKELDLKRLFPVFVMGIREEIEPCGFLGLRGTEEIIRRTPAKELIKHVRGIIYPLKDNLQTLDDDICIKTINVIMLLSKKSDAIAEAFVPLFNILLPSVDVLRNKHEVGVRKPKNRRPMSAVPEEKKFVKLVNLKRQNVNIGQLVQSMLEYFERHGGLFAYVTIKKLMPKYESCLFS